MDRSSVITRRVSGFTLIEVLVVVAIIALLVAILLPSLKNAREQSRAVICGARQSQIFLASFMYTQQNTDVLPHFGYRSDKYRVDWWWPTQLAKFVSYQFDLYTCPSDQAKPVIQVDFSKPRFLRMYVANPGQTSVPMEVTYRGSCDLLSDSNIWSAGGMMIGPMPRKIYDFKRPGTSLLLIEGSIDIGITSEQCFRYADLLDFPLRKTASFNTSWHRHLGRTNFLFMDGHVGRHTPEEAATRIKKQQEFISVAPVRGS